MKKIVKDALVLMAFSLVLGFVLGGVYKITEPIIAEATLRKEMEAYKVVFENADTFKQIEVNTSVAEAVAATYPDIIDKVFEAVDANGAGIGYVVQLTTKDGYAGGIVMVIGIQSDGTVNGFSITAHSETNGLGTKAFEPAYADQYKGVPAADVAGISTLSGATFTSTAIKNGVSAAIAYVDGLVGGAQ